MLVNIKTLFIAFLLAVGLSHAQAGVREVYDSTLECSKAFLKKEFQPYKHFQGLDLVPGPTVFYPQHSEYFSYYTRLNDVYLDLGAVKSREELENIAKILAQGKSHKKILNILTKYRKKKNFLVPLKLVTPEVVRKYTGKFSGCKGPNCWNATLNWHDPGVGIGPTGHWEILPALREEYTKLAPGEELRFGDVVALFKKVKDANFEEHTIIIHTAIYLNRNLVWHKASAYASDPWTFETTDQVMQHYISIYKNRPDQIPYLEFYRKK